jgi:hypothetical protein
MLVFSGFFFCFMAIFRGLDHGKLGHAGTKVQTPTTQTDRLKANTVSLRAIARCKTRHAIIVVTPLTARKPAA